MKVSEAEKVPEHVSTARWKICGQLEVFSMIQNYIHLLEDILKKKLGKYPKDVNNKHSSAEDRLWISFNRKDIFFIFQDRLIFLKFLSQQPTLFDP